MSDYFFHNRTKLCDGCKEVRVNEDVPYCAECAEDFMRYEEKERKRRSRRATLAARVYKKYRVALTSIIADEIMNFPEYDPADFVQDFDEITRMVNAMQPNYFRDIDNITRSQDLPPSSTPAGLGSGKYFKRGN